MTSFRVFRPLLVALVALTIGSTAPAQTPPTDGVQSLVEEMRGYTPEQKLQWVERAIEEIRSIQRSMLAVQESAPQCAQSRLVLVDSLIEVVLLVQVDMMRYQLAGNTTLADVELRKIAVAVSVARTLWAEVMGCAADDSTSGQVDVSVAYLGLVTEDGGDDTPFDFDGDDPPEVSPFQ